MKDHSVVFVGTDVSRSRIAVGLADGGGASEARLLGEIEASEERSRPQIWAPRPDSIGTPAVANGGACGRGVMALASASCKGGLEMAGAFEKREDTFEKEFAKDEALRFRAATRRNKAVALWIAGLKGLAPEVAEKYAEDFVAAQVGAGDDDVAAAFKQDVARGEVDLSDHRLRRKMAEEMVRALESVKAGK